MRRRDFLQRSSAALLGFLAPGYLSFAEADADPGTSPTTTASTAPTSSPARLLPSRGVTLSGAEFGSLAPGFSNTSPGKPGVDYLWNSQRTIAWFAERGFSPLRVPFRWERMQPRLGEALDPAELDQLSTTVDWARKHGSRVLLNVHNFGRYIFGRDEEAISMIIDEPARAGGAVTRDHFADLWRRLADAFKNDAAVFGYGLMNEPHDMGNSDWKAISQQAVDSIRATGDRHPILVPGVDWAGAGRFADANGTAAWINDPHDRTLYEAHCYFDHDASGTYALNYDQELALDPGLPERGVRRLLHFAGWCAINNAKGFIGEYGVPADPRWLAALQHFLGAADNANLPGCYWAAGEWWPPGDPLSLQPRDHFRIAAPQEAILLAR